MEMKYFYKSNLPASGESALPSVRNLNQPFIVHSLTLSV